MNDLEQKLNDVLSNPQMMQQIMSLAQSIGNSTQQQPASAPTSAGSSSADIDLGMVQTVAGMASSTSVDQNQRALLRALSPYISRDRVSKLEKAMRAAKMAAFASSLLQSQNRR